LKNSAENIEKKSLKERFFLVIGMVIFLAYFLVGVLIVFWKNFPISMKTNNRIALGVLLIIYSFIRGYRIFKDNKD